MIGTPAFFIAVRAAVLFPISSMAAGGGPIHTSPASSTARAKAGVLGEKAVPGMDRLGAGLLRCLEDPRDVEVALGRGTRPEEERLVGVRDVHRAAISLGIHGHRADAELRNARKTRIAISPRLATRTLSNMSAPYPPRLGVAAADQLTVARAASVPIVVLLFAWNFHGPRVLGDRGFLRRDGD